MGAVCCSLKPKRGKIKTAPSSSFEELLQEAKLLWKRGQLIGQGAYGKVYECLNLENGQLHAVKHVKLAGSTSQIEKQVSLLQKEISLLKSLSHKNIVKYLHAEITESKNGVYIIMEYVSGGSIRHLLDKFGKFEENLVRLYTKQILEGLSFLHSNRIIHRDIKSANLLVTQRGNIKLSDFGASKRLGGSCVDQCRSLRGSPYWMAPEVAKRVGHGFAADIWSVGCVVIEMLTGSFPWSKVTCSTKEVIRIISNTVSHPPIPGGISTECQEFLKCCLKVNPAERSTANELLTHSFIQQAS